MPKIPPAGVARSRRFTTDPADARGEASEPKPVLAAGVVVPRVPKPPEKGPG